MRGKRMMVPPLTRVLHGRASAATIPATAAVLVMLAYCGPALFLPLVIAVTAGWTRIRSRATCLGSPQP